MATQVTFIPSAEAAFIAGLNDRQMHRVVDEHLLPDILLGPAGTTRLFTRLGAAFARFYFATDALLVAGARRQIVEDLARRVEALPNRVDVFNLMAAPGETSWKLSRRGVEIDLAPDVAEVCARAKDVAQADSLVSVDPDVLGGTPVFAGTRVPIDSVLASADASIDPARLHASYPFLTQAHIDAARTYAVVHPRRGRPRRLSEANPAWKGAGSRTVRPARACRFASSSTNASLPSLRGLPWMPAMLNRPACATAVCRAPRTGGSSPTRSTATSRW